MFSPNPSSFSRDRPLASWLTCKHLASGVWEAGQNWVSGSSIQHTDLTSQRSCPQPAPARPGIPSAGLSPGQLFHRIKNWSKDWGLAVETVQRRLACCTFASSCPSPQPSIALCLGFSGWLSALICRLLDLTASVLPLSSCASKGCLPCKGLLSCLRDCHCSLLSDPLVLAVHISIFSYCHFHGFSTGRRDESVKLMFHVQSEVR